MADMDPDYILKLLLIGDSAVGKSSLIQQYTDHTYTESSLSTIGVDFKIHTLEVNGKLIKLTCYDTGGQERFRTITSSYYRGAHGIILVYDITSIESYQNIPAWLNDINRYASDNVSKILVGNKSDLKHKREIPDEDAKKLADHEDMKYIETSAKLNTNVDSIFLELTKEIIRTQMKLPLNPSEKRTISLDKKTEAPEKCSC